MSATRLRAMSARVEQPGTPHGPERCSSTSRQSAFRADTFHRHAAGSARRTMAAVRRRRCSGWRALLELGAAIRKPSPIRVEDARIASLDAAEIEECGIRLGRAARLTGAPLIIDATSAAVTAEVDHALRSLFTAIAGTGCRVGVICTDSARIARLLGSTSFLLMEGPRAIARGAGRCLCCSRQTLRSTAERRTGSKPHISASLADRRHPASR